MPRLQRPLIRALDAVNRRGKAASVRLVRAEFVAELVEGGFRLERALMPVFYDTPWAGLIDALGGVSLGLYARLARWKREAALRHQEESTGFRAVAVRAGVR